MSTTTSSPSSVDQGPWFRLSAEQEEVRKLARDFSDKEITPQVAEHHDKDGEFPTAIVKKAWEIGLMNCILPEEYGGLEMGALEECLIAEELAHGCMGISLSIMANNLGIVPVKLAGTDAQKKKYLAPLMEAPLHCAYGLTEPEVGSDPGSLATTCVKKGDKYILNGVKRWITGAGVADWYVIFATSDPSKKHRGINAFIVEKDHPGVSLGKKEDMMGQRASYTCDINLDDAEIPAENLLGEEGTGFYTAMKTFQYTRPAIAAGAVGVAQNALDHSLRYSLERQTFGTYIANHQAVQFMLADMHRDIEAGRLLTWQCAWMCDQGIQNNLEVAVAKVFTSDRAMQIATDAVQIFGGYGYSREYPVEKLMRDVKVTQIYEGTSQVQKIVIGRAILRDMAKKMGLDPKVVG
ncbi:MAG: acyl-CoA dehydrogenase [Gemmatimonadota bacterium]|nr:MAG: acyl-CoA dehydrogenase [Gemmatimonadota bacterium]